METVDEGMARRDAGRRRAELCVPETVEPAHAREQLEVFDLAAQELVDRAPDGRRGVPHVRLGNAATLRDLQPELHRGEWQQRREDENRELAPDGPSHRRAIAPEAARRQYIMRACPDPQHLASPRSSSPFSPRSSP
jgi:hypothetical protein